MSRSPPSSWKGNPNYSSYSVNIFNHKDLVQAFSQDLDAIVCAWGPAIDGWEGIYRSVIEGHHRIKTAVLASSLTGEFIIIGMSTFSIGFL